ncbi:MAG: universal stress protein [Chloroflexi bacterium]|nr:MAG: universal stress protein [Chloroflexota bacterium]
MNKRILLGIDTDLSPSTQYALRITSELLEWAPQLRLVLLHVIPTPFDSRPTSYYPTTHAGKALLEHSPYCRTATGDFSRTRRASAACGNACG